MARHDGADGGRDEGVSPVVMASALGALLESPVRLVPQHWKKRGSGLAVCGVGGQLAATEGAVTCEACKARLAKAKARRERRANASANGGWGSPRATREDGVDYDFERALKRAEAEDSEAAKLGTAVHALAARAVGGSR